MESLAAVGLAANILQFIEVFLKVVKEGYDIYESVSGTTEENTHSIVTASDLQVVTETLSGDLLGSSKDELALKGLAVKCEALSRDLLKILDSLTIKGRKKRIKSLWLGLENVRKRPDLLKIRGNLEEYRSQMSMRLNLMLSGPDSPIFKRIERLSCESEKFQTESAKQLECMRDDIITTIKNSEPGDLKDVVSSLRNLKSSIVAIPVENRILEALYFPSMHDRETNIRDAESGTYDWLLLDEHKNNTLEELSSDEEPSSNDEFPLNEHEDITLVLSSDDEHENTTLEELPSDEDTRYLFDTERQNKADARSSLLAWLRTGDGVYHISGKPGSGKSTLMKFLCEHPRTVNELNSWAGQKKLVIARFFFWKAGSDLQKSIHGLLRSLLFEILRKCPNLIPGTFPRQWRLLQNTLPGVIDNDLFLPKDVQEAFKRLVQNSQVLAYRFCFFIDGLDEYDGDDEDHRELCRQLRIWSIRHDIKLCVSSRPYKEFCHGFSDSPARRLHLHEVNRCDIFTYSWKMVARGNKSRGLHSEYLFLIHSIVEKSEGVFLWAWLVVRSVLNGILRYDPIKDLRRILDMTPRELDDLYGHLLDSLNDADRARAVKILLLVAYNPFNKPLNGIVFQWIDDLQDKSFPTRDHIRRLDDVQLRETRGRVDGQVRSITKGFLEIAISDSEDWQWQNDWTLRYKFFHRTALDFIIGHPKLADIANVRGMITTESYHRLYLAELMAYDLSHWEWLYPRLLSWDTVLHEDLPISLLERFSDEFEAEADSAHLCWDVVFSVFGPSGFITRSSNRISFLHLAACRNQTKYVLKEVKKTPVILEGTRRLNLLCSAAIPSLGKRKKNYGLVLALLKKGASPRAEIRAKTPNKESCYFPVGVLLIANIVAGLTNAYLKNLREGELLDSQELRLDKHEAQVLEILLEDISPANCDIFIHCYRCEQNRDITLEQIIRETSLFNKHRILSVLQQHSSRNSPTDIQLTGNAGSLDIIKDNITQCGCENSVYKWVDRVRIGTWDLDCLLKIAIC
ncbi:hypothetical protein FQN57_004597 [Myotisia sp. PD_48]|nr:hypothetical protein FQN57_004597 [Myotisia sp. PD_48]